LGFQGEMLLINASYTASLRVQRLHSELPAVGIA
jgi:hypothetical protein